jgi:hypothetical protein
VITRAALAAVVLVAIAVLPVNMGRCLDCAPSGVPWLDAFARWDGRWYVSIAETGYVFREAVGSDLAFFPLYPTLTRIVAGPFGPDRAALVASGIVVSLGALLVSLLYLARLARLDADAASARRAVLYVLIYPTTVFLSAVYAESLFLALAAAGFWYARTERWSGAGAASALAALTRPFGVLLALALAVELEAAHRSSRRRPWPWAALALGPLALAAWAAYLWSMTGRPLAFMEAHAAWAVRPGNAVSAITDLFDERVYAFPWLVAGLLIMMAVLTVYAWRVRISYGVYSALLFAALLSPGTVTSSMRHELGMFPAFIALGILGSRRWLHWTYVAIGGLLSLVLGAMFALSHWIG